MRQVALILTVGTLACVSTYGQQFSAPTDRTLDSAFDCVSSEVTGLAYTIKDADREAGFLRAQKEEPSGISMMDNQPVFPTIEASVTGPDSARRVNVTIKGVSDRSDVDSVLSVCAEPDAAEE